MQPAKGVSFGAVRFDAEAKTKRVEIRNEGKFDFTFVVPKDISLNMGRGKISYYAFSDASDAFGFDTNFRIGGINPNGINDVEGPQLNLFINDENFISGSITDESPVMILQAFDENGINTVGNGIGHDLVAILDGNSAEPILLNDYYSAALDSYQSGEIRYQFTELEQGKHTLEVKVWDVNNNSSVIKTEFVVQDKANTMLEHVYNYPNHFNSSTTNLVVIWMYKYKFLRFLENLLNQ
jgi:hypothetical protein